jgi:tyrocidine synthetase III
LSTVKALLYRFSGQEDIVVGTPVTGREHKDLEDQIGFYLNNLPIRTTFKGSNDFGSLLEKVREGVLGAFEHQIYPYDLLLQDLINKRNFTHSSLFDVVVVLQNDALHNQRLSDTIDNATSPNVDIRDFNIDFRTSTVDLRIVFEERKEIIITTIEYNKDIFKEVSIATILGKLKQLTAEIAINAKVSINEIDLGEEVFQESLNEPTTNFNF